MADTTKRVSKLIPDRGIRQIVKQCTGQKVLTVALDDQAGTLVITHVTFGEIFQGLQKGAAPAPWICRMLPDFLM